MQEDEGNIIPYMMMFPPIELYNHGEKCKKVRTVLITMGEGLWEGAELGVGQRGGGRQKNGTN